ncbi:MAG: polyketide cyclase [SAR116 cluster bacterium]|nr:polyketide cyclase [SAR116 cluster bacterium]
MSYSNEKRKHYYNQLHSLILGGHSRNVYHNNAEIFASHPINEISGLKEINKLWEALMISFPDIERRDSIFVSGINYPDDRAKKNIEGIELVASICHYQGTFENNLFGIPASKKVVYLRSCEVHQFLNEKIIKSYIIFDFLNLMKQVGLSPISPSLGTDFFWPAPATADGVKIKDRENLKSTNSFQVVMNMHKALGEYDGKNIESMKHSQYWSKNFLWYGPSGIGTSKGMKNFRNFHQIPFLRGFPDRRGASHYIRIEDDNFVVTGGWPSVEATHGGEWLGIPATNKKIKMRVMDFYRLENNVIAENWVPIDIIHILYQMGFDVFARLKEM